MLNKLSVWVGIVVGLLAVGGIVFAAGQTYYKIETLQASQQQLSVRLDQKILEDRRYNYLQRIWEIEKQYPVVTSRPPEIKDQMKWLLEEIRKIDKQLEALKK